MKRFFSVFVFVLVVQLAVGQVKLGLKFSPLLSLNQVELISDTLDMENASSTARFSLGLIVDKPFSDTYYFSTGLIIMPKRVSINILPENGGTTPNTFEAYNLQYLQIPLTLKLYTNEIQPDLSIFFQVGGSFEIKVDDRPKDEDYILIEKFNPFDIGAMLGTGAEYRIGINTILFGGFSYQQGLINVVNEAKNDLDLTIKNSVITLDLGVKF